MWWTATQSPPPEQRPPPTAEDPDHSETIVQEPGADEADVVKTDGNYLYILSNNELVIMDAWPAEQTHIVSRTPIEGYAVGMYLLGDSVTIVSDVYSRTDPRMDDDVDQPTDEAQLICPWWYYGKQQIQVTVLNVLNREQPEILEETKLDGRLSESRLIDGRLYLVLDNSLDFVEPMWLAKDAPAETDLRNLEDPTTIQWVYETEASYRARLEAMTLEELLPGYTTTATDADGQTTQATGDLAQAANLLMPDAGTGTYQWNMFSVVLMDLKDSQSGPATSTSVVGVSGQVYASADSLYVTAQRYEAPMGVWRGELKTDIYQFALEEDTIRLAATGDVPGWIVNPFAMDQQGDYLRIATTSSTTDGTANNVFVLQAQDGVLLPVGELTGLALSEQVYAARFEGDRGYLVTFRQTDPLLTLDLTDPETPKVTQALTIPGYSAYLHPFEYTDSNEQAHHMLIGVGRDTDDQGRILGVQVSLFDVTNLEDPKRLGMYTYANTETWNAGGWTAAEWDHHAFAYFPQYQILTLPRVTYRSTSTTEVSSLAGLDVLKLDPENTDPAQVITLLGTVEHAAQPQRSVRIGPFLYSVGTDAVNVVPLQQPDTLVVQVALPQGLPEPTPAHSDWPVPVLSAPVAAPFAETPEVL
ncbi:MAG TPA: beta-propeller domain-containing protein, partial [Tepidisphaeraceae bacterium]|nr:beta-propeller domain-containing protein [Tepidisphaeraceae bacterium]